MNETLWLGKVAIVGRPNVGKSSLFNRILGERKAIVEDEPGTTRDRVEADVEWRGSEFRLIDTGGYETDEENVYASLIGDQVSRSMDEADIVLFCVDARDGLTASDHDMATLVRESERPVLLVATKADNLSREETGVADAWQLGFGEAIPVSAVHDVNVGHLLDEVVARLRPKPREEVAQRVRVAIIGRPNVGKSMLLNALVGGQRVIVSDVAGTTRDAIDTELSTAQGDFVIIDTAGVRRPGKQGVGVERHSVTRMKGAVDRCDVAVLVIDGTEGVTAQDAHIAGMAMEAHTGLIVAVNKIDLWEDPVERRSWLERQMRGRLRFLPWAMICHISALEGRGLDDLLRLAIDAREARRRRIPTGELNALFKKAVRAHVPPVVHHKRLKLLYVTQAGIDPPTFVVFVNDPAIVHFSYRRYLERSIREAHDFEGTAIKLVFKARSEDDKPPKGRR